MLEQNQNQEKKQRVFSGLKPTGGLTIGNYIGALKNMAAMQSKYDCFYSVVDMHSITVDILPSELRKNSLNMLAFFISCGIDPTKSTIFIQSHVSAHAELAWILNCFCMMGEAKRMIQFKEKSAQDKQNVNVGLFSYPVLQAADIFLYNSDLVPIGKDQKQHLELAKTLAERFNQKFSPTFVVPKAVIAKEGAKVFSLLDPGAKMGKTDQNPQGVVFLFDDKDTVIKKFKRAVTDSGSEVVFDQINKAGISNLLTIYSAFVGRSIKECEGEFVGASYAQFKERVGEAVAEVLIKIQGEYARVIADKGYLEGVARDGAERAGFVANRVLDKVKRKVGFLQ
ncbi:MAG: tryptophan--tRNA ligase [Firmicutes bacterium]|nr:tryptophan--tRNA ligase [Bacillota bacterium]